jgi:hypothetical protein
MMTVRERIIAALNGEKPDKVPFTIYDWLTERNTWQDLFDLGLGIINRYPPYKLIRQDVETDYTEIVRDGIPGTLVTCRTPVGTLTRTVVRHTNLDWTVEHEIKTPDDYAAFEFILRNTSIEPDIDGYNAAVEEIGDNGLVIPRAADPPIQEFWRHHTGVQRIFEDLYDCPDKVRRILDVYAEMNRTIWDIVAAVPGGFCCSGGNISGDIIGPPMFDEFCMPHFEAEAEIMHGAGKRTLNHMDGLSRRLVNNIARSPVDIIEAFNPLPDGDMSVKEALDAWPGKSVSINFPSSIHLASDDVIRETTIGLIRESAPGNRFILGITEDVPPERVMHNLTIIGETIHEYGKL